VAANSFGTQINSIAVNNGDVYAVGFLDEPNNGLDAASWLNGGSIPLSGVAGNSYASSVFVNGKDVYVAGGTNNSFGNDRALYWKNGNPVFLKNGADSTGLYANGIVVQ
jgi:hypothetical protein